MNDGVERPNGTKDIQRENTPSTSPCSLSSRIARPSPPTFIGKYTPALDERNSSDLHLALESISGDLNIITLMND